MNSPAVLIGSARGGGGVRAVCVSKGEARTGAVSMAGLSLPLNPREFQGELAQSSVLEHQDGTRTIAVGLGDDPASPAALNAATAAAVRAASAFSQLELHGVARICAGRPVEASATIAAEAVQLASYRYLKHKSTPAATDLRTVYLADFATGAQQSIDLGRHRGRATNLARDLTNEPAEDLSPEALAAKAGQVANSADLELRVYDEEELRALGCGALLAVGKGSSRPPRLIHLRYQPPESTGHLALVGKGITFDSGGLNTKSAAGMEEMRADMAGAATVLAVMSLMPQLQPRFSVSAWLAAADNMSGPAAMRPGDIVRTRNGRTVEILNTDAEGRLVLADALALASEQQPDAIVDVATLTDTVSDALGPNVAGVMGNNRELVRQIFAAGRATGEAVWPLPLPRSFEPLIESDVADLRNLQRGHYGFVVAGGCFLQHFVNDTPWAHIDVGMAAMRADHDTDHQPPGATGWGVRLLSSFVEDFTTPEVDERTEWDPF